MVKEKKSFKEMSVVPNKKDFVDAILSLKEHQKQAIVLRKFKKSYRHFYAEKVWRAQKSILDKLSPVLDELPLDFNGNLLFERFPPVCVSLARRQVLYATIVIREISKGLSILLKKDDCDSLDQCKRLKVAALGCIITLAIRCIPSLEYLDRVREYMANLEDDEIAAAAASLTDLEVVLRENQDVLPEEDCTVPHTLDVHKAADFVDPETMSWLWELERKHGFMLKDDAQVDSLKLAHKHKEQHESIGDLRASLAKVYPRL